MRCYRVAVSDQDVRGTNELSKIESPRGTGKSCRVSRDRRLACIALLLALLLFCPGLVSAKANHEIRLVLQITVDGLRGDLLDRYGKNFSKDGFNYLLKNGTVYTNTHYQHANTETIVGHTTLATGASPSHHGMIGNAWLDQETGELAYNIEDPDSPLLPTRETEVKGEQVDPAQRLARTQGRSPTAIQAATLSDTMAAYYGGKSKVYAVSGKDRGAVPMAGQVGKAFWMSTDSGDFVTSSYYYDSYPTWAREWNEQRKAEGYAGKSWTLLNDASTYLLGDQDNRSYEADLKGFGITFPHRYGEAGNKLLYTQILVSPVGDQLILDFAKSLMSSEQLGQDDIPDYLSVSFSGVDAVNHFFGPSSLENEDVVIQLDRTLADLLKYVDESVGLKNTLIVLSADHGMADMPEYMTEEGFSAGRLTLEEVTDAANQAGERLFGIGEIVRAFYRPYMYLDVEKVRSTKLDVEMVTRKIAAELTNINGIAIAVPSNGIPGLENSRLIEQIRRNFHPTRSGDIYVVQDPYWFLFGKGPVVMHGSPWRFDTHVPLIFAGPGIKARRISREVHPVDVAPTLAAIIGLTPPSSAQGTVLKELFR